MPYATFNSSFDHHYNPATTHMPPRIKLDLFYDIGSSYSYYAFEILCRYENIWNLDLQLHPTLLGAVFKITGNVSPAATQYKRVHMLNDIGRLSEEFQVPLTIGPEFPGNTLNAMRLLRYLKDHLPADKLKEATRHYFKENFVVNTPLSSPSFLTSLPPSILSKPKLEEAIQNLKSVTETMKVESAGIVEKYGAFGFPWMVVERPDGEVASFWGSDRFSSMSWWLGADQYPWLGPVPAKAAL